MTPATQDPLAPLVSVAAAAAARGANRYLFTRNLTCDDAVLADCLKERLKAAMPEALRDAKEAIECNMADAASATFQASMVNAGIEAAKDAAARWPPPQRPTAAEHGTFPAGRW